MHMGNELLNPQIGAVLLTVAGIVVALAARKVGKELNEKSVPMMGVMGAFVFAAQMINFPVLAGTSGHLGGGTLLAILLGPHAAAIVMASVLIVQCIIFQDGGLLALGANIINLGIVPAYLGYAVFSGLRAVLKFRRGTETAMFLATFVSVVSGAALVPVEVTISRLYAVPFPLFLGLMAGVHAIIGCVEALLTIGVVDYIRRMRPDLVRWETAGVGRMSFRGLTLSVLGASVIIAGFVSWYASSNPDGLEWILKDKLQLQDLYSMQGPEDPPALLPDYDVPIESLKTDHPRLSKGLAGAMGTVITLGVIAVAGVVLRRKHREPTDAT